MSGTLTSDATSAILTALKAVWDPRAMIPDGVNAAPPSDGSAWCRPVVNDEVAAQETLGDHPKVERHGRLLVQVFVPANNAGIRPALLLGEVIRAAFECKTLYTPGPIHFRGVLVRRGSPSPTDGRWVMAIVDAPFTYWEQK